MNTENYLENNHIILMGKITSEKRYSHEIYGETFYIFDLEVSRLSDITDIIPVTISERLITNEKIEIGRNVVVEGQFRSYNTYDENNKNKLVLTVFAKEIEFKKEDEVIIARDTVSNEVTLMGYICKKPLYRKTPFGREIADMLVAVNRSYSKSDYIPCISWGRTARFCNDLEVGTAVKIVGRVQSRKYEKKNELGEVFHKVAYEVSIGRLELANKEEKTETEIDEDKEAI